MVCSWLSTLPPEVNQPRPLWANEGQPLMKTKTIIATSRPTTATTSEPSISSARPSDHRGTSSAARYSSSRRYPSVANYFYFLVLERLNAGTPPDLAMILPAIGLVRTQSANRCTSGFGLLVGVTKKMNRDSGYFSFLTFFAEQATPFRLTDLTDLSCQARPK